MSAIRTSLITLLLVFVSSTLLAAEKTLILGNGIPLKILFFEPDESLQPPPLALFIAGGTSNEFMARAQFWFGRELVERGWAIAVPISPDGKLFSVESAKLFPELIEKLRSDHDLDDAKPLLIGMSSGGSAALEIATANPTVYRGVVAAPGRLKEDALIDTLQGLPVYLRVGERDDFRWNLTMQNVVARLRAAGAAVDADIMPDARHIFRLDWDNLEDWLQNLQ